MLSHGRAQRGVAIIETVIALPILLTVILGAIQFGLIYEAKATLNYATLQAARSGAVSHADQGAIRQGLARGIVPLYSPDSSLSGYASAFARANQDVSTDARIRILNPTREAFDDFGQDVEGQRELPNDHLQSRSTTVGPRSGLNIQDANLLRVQITYGYELKVPLVNWFITRTLLAFRGSRAMDSFEQQLLRRTFLPIVSTSTVRMQSPARLNDAMVARSDLPEGERFAANTPPSDPADNSSQQDDDEDDSDHNGSSDDAGDGSSLDDGFFGFGSGHGAGTADEGNSGNGQGSESDGGPNSGDPQMCDGSGETPEQPTPAQQLVPGLLSDPGSAAASLPNRLPDLSVGNPIHVATGNKYQHEIDVASLPGKLGLSFSRHYNSELSNSELSNRSGSLGAGWRHNFDAHLQVRTAIDDEIQVTQADGRAIKFLKVDHTHYRAQRVGDGELFVNQTSCSTGACSEYTWRWDGTRELIFDDAGALTAIREGALAVHLEYGVHHRLEHVIDPEARVLALHYDRKGRISSVQITGGATRKFKYDHRNNLVEVIATDRRARRYHYEDPRHPHHLTGISAGIERLADYGRIPLFERIATWAYDDQGRGILSTHALNSDKVTLQFGQGFTDVTDAFGRVSRYVTQARDGIVLVSEVRGPGCSVCGGGDVSYAYSDAYAVTEQRKKDRPMLRYEYDANSRLVAAYRDGSLLAHYEYENQNTEASAVDLPSVNPDGHHRIETVARADGLPMEIRESGYEPTDGGFNRIERVYRLVYDQSGQLSQIDGPRRDVEDITKFEYDPLHRLVAIINPDGNEQRVLARDNAGRPTLIRHTGQPDVEMSYDVEGRLTSLSTDLHGGIKLRTQFRYDARGRMHEVELPDHRIWHVTFDAADRIVEERTLEGLRKITKYASDGQVIQQSLLDSGILLKTLHFAFDRDRRLTEVRDGDGPALQQLQYSGSSHSPSSVIDALGRQTRLAYDSLGSVDQVSDGTSAITHLDHDSLQRVIAVESPSGHASRFKYDDFGRKVEEISPDRGVVHYRYDATDHLISRTDARGKIRTHEYSRAETVETVRDDDGESHFIHRNGRLVSVIEPNGSRRFTYDDDGRLTRAETRIASNQFATELRYDELGRVAKKRLFSGDWLSYTYDKHGALASVRMEKLLLDEKVVERTSPTQTKPLSSLSDARFGNGVVARNVIDADARLSSRETAAISRLDYRYDDANRVTSLTTDGRAQRFGYDDADRLTSVKSPGEYSRYEYDTNANRTRASQGSIEKRYDYDSGSNRLLAVDDAKVTYDAAGNIKAVGDRSYEYNSAGRPIHMWVAGKLIAQYAYNVSGERIRKVDYSQGEQVITDYLYEQHKLVAEADGSGRVNREYIYLGQHPVATIDRGELLWIHTDHLGAPIAVTDKNRRVVWRAKYEPFGNAAVDEDPDQDGESFELNLRRPGQYADRESGTYYNYYRDYDPSLGRYLTSDPLGVVAGTNTYAYAHSDPVNRFDPLGLYDGYVHFYMTYFLALVAGLPPEVANTIATATQYIDENPLTSPIVGSVSDSLPRYHFTLDYDGTPYHGDSTDDPLTRFYDPRSPQLSNLYRITTEQELNKLWDEVHPLEAGMCPFRRIEETRYQLFGEFLHAYEDTFAHRDSQNMPYDIYSFNDDNDPPASVGHVGTQVPDGSHAPDHSYNRNYTSASQCRILLDGSYVTFPMGEAECEKRNGTYIPADWQYNELRTLRMEYETFEFLKNDFSTAIGNNLAQGAHQFSWQDLAGTSTWDRSSVRIGSTADLPVGAVLQEFNAAPDTQKWQILSDWLDDHGFSSDFPVLVDGNLESPGDAMLRRQENLGWIPKSAEGRFHVLLPATPGPPDQDVD